jgi:hypothetical protein
LLFAEFPTATRAKFAFVRRGKAQFEFARIGSENGGSLNLVDECGIDKSNLAKIIAGRRAMSQRMTKLLRSKIAGWIGTKSE